MNEFVLLFLAILQIRPVRVFMASIEIRRDGIWKVTRFYGGHHGQRIIRWPVVIRPKHPRVFD